MWIRDLISFKGLLKQTHIHKHNIEYIFLTILRTTNIEELFNSISMRDSGYADRIQNKSLKNSLRDDNHFK